MEALSRPRVVDYFGPLPTREKAVWAKDAPFPHSNARLSGGTTGAVTIKIDLAKLAAMLNQYSIEVQDRALYNALRRSTDPVKTRMQRILVNQTGLKLSRVSSALDEKKPHPRNLTWELKAKDAPVALIDFAQGAYPSQGRRGTSPPVAAPWNKKRKFEGAFVVGKAGDMQIVTRAAMPWSKHAKNKGGYGLKVLWGPATPKEMIRQNTPALKALMEIVPLYFEPTLMYELRQAAARAGAK